MRVEKFEPEWRPYPDIRRGKAGQLPYIPPPPQNPRAFLGRTFGSDDEGFLTQVPYSEDETGRVYPKGEKPKKNIAENEVDSGAVSNIAMSEHQNVDIMDSMKALNPFGTGFVMPKFKL